MSSETTPANAPPLTPPEASADTLLGVTERLEKSRRLMRTQLLQLNLSASQAQAKNQHSGHAGAILTALTALPVMGPLLKDVVRWWEDHPLRALADLFARPAASTTEPLTQRHPWAMLIGAAAAGALLMWARPWRFSFLRRAVYGGLLPQVMTSLLSRVSTDGLLDLAQSLWRRPSESPVSASAAQVQPPSVHADAPASRLH